MDLQTRKLNAIEYLIGLKDEKIFRKIESSIFEIRKGSKTEKRLKPFTQKQLIERAEQSNHNYKNGNFKIQSELERESLNW